MFAFVADHERFVIRLDLLDTLRNHLEHVLVERVSFGMEFEAGRAIAQIKQTRPGVRCDNIAPAAHRSQTQHTGRVG